MNNYEQYDYTRDKNKEDSEYSYDEDDFKYLTDLEDYKNSEKSDAIYQTYSQYKMKKDLIKSNDPDYQDNAGFDYVKEYYASNILENQTRRRMIQFFFLTSISVLFFISLAFYRFTDNTPHAIYIQKNSEVKSSQGITKDEMDAFRMNFGTKAHGMPKEVIEKPKEIENTATSIVNNYNFDQLNTGLTTLGYSLLACFITFFSFKGLSTISKSFKLKREIKKSIRLLNDFKSVISQQNNQLEISQLINDQIVINNILIERLNKNNNVVQLIAINEKMKDTSQFINNNLIENLKGD